MAKRKRAAKVYVLPGVERRDMAGTVIPSEEVLRAAILKGVGDVVLVGRARNGKLYVSSSGNDVDKSCGLLMRAVGMLSNGDFSS